MTPNQKEWLKAALNPDKPEFSRPFRLGGWWFASNKHTLHMLPTDKPDSPNPPDWVQIAHDNLLNRPEQYEELFDEWMSSADPDVQEHFGTGIRMATKYLDPLVGFKAYSAGHLDASICFEHPDGRRATVMPIYEQDEEEN